ncbi:MAG: hypothetical protein Q8902_10600 [Bacteroidota bacterium]|nr:hypothetical protein [Bacteroidota bacterium]MDP4233559.1 hypothetical protein [Bacteroidota bacterium]MDP4243666.1 hypothetical protein [Bacteroidota bacterium]
MKRGEHRSQVPLLKKAVYTIVEQDGIRFVLVGFTTQWTWRLSSNVFAAYRLEHGAPNQVWRSRPWEATYDQLSFKTAMVGRRSIVLFQEGGDAKVTTNSGGYDSTYRVHQFGLAGVFTFQNKPEGLIVNDLTPSLPWLRAFTHFPFRPLYGTSITLSQNDSRLMLSASDQEYQIGLETAVRPARTWQYIPRRDRFEPVRHSVRSASQLTHVDGE